MLRYVGIFRRAYQKFSKVFPRISGFLEKVCPWLKETPQSEEHEYKLEPDTSAPIVVKPVIKPEPFGSVELETVLGKLRTMPRFFPRNLLVNSVSDLTTERYGADLAQKLQIQEQCDGLVVQIKEACETEDIRTARELREEIRLLKYQVLDDRLQERVTAAITAVYVLEQELTYRL